MSDDAANPTPEKWQCRTSMQPNAEPQKERKRNAAGQELLPRGNIA